MRKQLALVSLIAVTACKGGGPETVGGTAVSAPAGSAAAAVPTSGHSFVTPTETKTYQAQGTVQSFGYDYVQRVRYAKEPVRNAAGQPVVDELGFTRLEVNTASRTLVADGQARQLYTANAGTVRDPRIQVTYDPRNAQFTLAIAQNDVSTSTTFQDPAHRTDFAGAVRPQDGVPDLTADGIRYLQVDNGSTDTITDRITFFYQQPGTTTKYVTFAGYVRNRFEGAQENTIGGSDTTLLTAISRRTLLERATFVFGEKTDNNAVPKAGSATYSGQMLGSIINNPTLENGDKTYFQWMSGTASLGVDFAAGTVTTSLAGTTFAPFVDPSPIIAPMAGAPSTSQALPAGAAFAAAGSGRIDLVGTGGFVGNFSSAGFAAGGTVQKVDIAGSTLDGAFYGPKADEIGATFRIVGGVPDQRVDITGAFTGVKK